MASSRGASLARRSRRAVPRRRLLPGGAPDASSSTSVARSLEFMVEMSRQVRRRGGDGVRVRHRRQAVVANLAQNTVRVVAAGASADDVQAAIVDAGYEKCRLVGQGALESFGEDLAARLGTNLRTLHQSLAAVAEFKGEAYGHGAIVGVARFVQVDEETLLVEGKLGGLEPDARYRISRLARRRPAASRASAGCTRRAATRASSSRTRTETTVPSRVVDGRLKAWDIIGRSVAIEPEPESKDVGKARRRRRAREELGRRR